MRPRDLAADAVAAAQLELITRQQALAAGMTSPMISRRVGNGTWERRHPGVFATAGRPWPLARRALAAQLGAGPNAVTSHRTAAALWGVNGLRVAVVEACVPTTRARRLEGVVLHRTADLGPTHRTTLDGVPITTPARTLVDLGAVARPWLVRKALEQWATRGLLDVADVVALLAQVRRRGREGAGVLGRVLAERALGDAVADSEVESALADLLARHGLPVPQLHHLVVLGAHTFELDFAYPDLRIGIEVDGWLAHGDRAAFERDRWRLNLLREHGWQMLQFTPSMVLQRGRSVVAQVTALRATAGASSRSA